MRRLLKYAVVGGLGTITNEAVFLSSVRFMPIIFSLAIAIEVSIIFNFFMNDIWTFKDKRVGNIWTRLWKFHGSSFSGSIVHYSVVIAFLFFLFHFSNSSEVLLFLLSSYAGVKSLFLATVNFLGILSGFSVRYLTSIKLVWG
ncbi:GtrA family protein [Candidatus Acidianus copahuensis]|uniref:Sugar translocase n=1 Tax=Candidatus Acidianus copahuensis TaxID=1160895 RepID=A0A031LLZ4_9CREN|nr:GtrA family protein [Candidatus Acidianus copahuensis]EZQ01898.1 sugar translocase [Candidatus Acidianus copahuensis]